MSIIDFFSKLLLAPPDTGKSALFYGTVLIAVPTTLGLVASRIVEEIGFAPYFPFVLISVLLLNWKYAAAVVLVSAVLGDWLFVGPPLQLLEGPSDVFGIIAFLGSSALIIGLVQSARTIVDNSLRPAGSDGLPPTVVFSLESGQAWASWYGSHSWVRLGPEDQVAEMMTDFLAQRELGKRLNKHVQ